MMLRVGLTGGVGSGKSLVADLFAELGAPIIDTDILARDVVAPDTEGYQQVVEHFGSSFVSSDGTIKRNALKKLVFNHPEERLWLEKTLHPLIRELANEKMKEISSPYCIVAIPLLAENWPHPLIDRVLVVDSPEELQIKRVTERDKCSPQVVQAIIDAQASREERLAIADDVILNDKDISSLKEQVTNLHVIYSGSRLPPG